MHNLKILSLIYLVAWVVTAEMVSKLKMTNLKCQSYNESLAIFEECRLRVIGRDVAKANVLVNLLHPVYKIHMNGSLLKRALGGYKPIGLAFSVDVCQYFIRRNNPILNAIHDTIKDYINMNHSCPYVGRQMVKDFVPKQGRLAIPVPTGDYLALLIMGLNGGQGLSVGVYFEFIE